MRVVHLSTSDIQGGAARGAYWLHTGLRSAGIDSKMLVANKASSDDTVICSNCSSPGIWLSTIRRKLDRLAIRLYPKRQLLSPFSPALAGINLSQLLGQIQPDIVNLHWVCRGFLRPESIAKINRPLVWTVRDMWPFTGGCHYAGDCGRYVNACGACPQLGSITDKDLSHWTWMRKNKSWANLNITVVGLSDWISDCARHSSLFEDKRVVTIHNGVNHRKFAPVPKEVARQTLGIPQDRSILLFGAVNALERRKGIEYLLDATSILSETDGITDLSAMVFGKATDDELHSLSLPVMHIGYISDDSILAMYYSAADVMVVPSIQEAFGKTAIEALACGTPVVAFDNSGLKDVVEHKGCGYLAKCCSAQDLAQGIEWVLSDRQRLHQLSVQARQRVIEHFTVDRQVNRYIELYNDLLEH